MLTVTAFFSGVLALMLIALSVNVIVDRYRFRLTLGDGGQAGTNRKIRAQANFAEYVPMALLLMGMGEINGWPKTFLMTLGTALVIGRISHAYGLLMAEARSESMIVFRQIGMALTFGVIITAACASIF